MKLKNIEEIATKKVPVWQPALLISLLLLGTFVIPLIAKTSTQTSSANSETGSTLGVETFRDTVDKGISSVVKPLSNQLQKEAGVVLGLAQQTVLQTVQNIASQSANQAKEYIFDNTLGKVLQNINTLPVDQQNLIKKAICK